MADKNQHRASKAALFIILSMFALFAGFGPGSDASEKPEEKEKKSRFELSEKTLVDNKTRLMWPLNGHLAEQTVPWHGASEFIDRLNRDIYEGYKNWRLPSREELETLTAHAKEQGFGGDRGGTVAEGLQALGMKNIKEDEYWTSTESIYNSGEAWFVNMRNGRAGTGMKTLYFSILPVRSLK